MGRLCHTRGVFPPVDTAIAHHTAATLHKQGHPNGPPEFIPAAYKHTTLLFSSGADLIGRLLKDFELL